MLGFPEFLRPALGFGTICAACHWVVACLWGPQKGLEGARLGRGVRGRGACRFVRVEQGTRTALCCPARPSLQGPPPGDVVLTNQQPVIAFVCESGGRTPERPSLPLKRHQTSTNQHTRTGHHVGGQKGESAFTPSVTGVPCGVVCLPLFAYKRNSSHGEIAVFSQRMF